MQRLYVKWDEVRPGIGTQTLQRAGRTAERPTDFLEVSRLHLLPAIVACILLSDSLAQAVDR